MTPFLCSYWTDCSIIRIIHMNMFDQQSTLESIIILCCIITTNTYIIQYSTVHPSYIHHTCLCMYCMLFIFIILYYLQYSIMNMIINHNDHHTRIEFNSSSVRSNLNGTATKGLVPALGFFFVSSNCNNTYSN